MAGSMDYPSTKIHVFFGGWDGAITEKPERGAQ